MSDDKRRLLEDLEDKENLHGYQYEWKHHEHIIILPWLKHHTTLQVLLNTESIEARDNGDKHASYEESDDMEEAYHPLHLMDGVFDYLLYHYGKPQCIELGHIVEEGGEGAHDLADLGSSGNMGEVLFDLVVGQAQVSYVELLHDGHDLVEGLQGQDYQEESAHISPTLFK